MRNKTILAALLAIILSVSSSFAAQDQQIQQKLAALENLQGKFSFIDLCIFCGKKDSYEKSDTCIG